MQQLSLQAFAASEESRPIVGRGRNNEGPAFHTHGFTKAGAYREGLSISPVLSRPGHYSLTYEEAREFAFFSVGVLPLGSRFTCYRLFNGLLTRFDRRRLGAIMQELVRSELVERVAYVPEERENGNAGITALFEVKKKLM